MIKILDGVKETVSFDENAKILIEKYANATDIETYISATNK